MEEGIERKGREPVWELGKKLSENHLKYSEFGLEAKQGKREARKNDIGNSKSRESLSPHHY